MHLGLTLGSDGNMWFGGDGWVRRITPAGAVTEFSRPVTSDIVSGSDGNLWFIERFKVGRMTTAGVLTGEFTVPLPTSSGSVNAIAAGPDGNLWITEGFLNGIAKMTPAGVTTQYPIDIGFAFPNGSTDSRGITVGPDGAMWFSGADHPPSGQKAVGRITTTGAVSYVITSLSGIRAMNGITAGPDGNIWATASGPGGGGLARITPAGGLSFFLVPPTSSGGGEIATGPDGCLWFTEPGLGKIGKACLSGPRVTNITSTNADGAYLTGATVPITVTFGVPVIVSGSPTLTLNSGGTATYTSGSGTNTLTFTYTVGAGDITPRLDAALAVQALTANFPGQTMALRLNGGTIRDGSGNDAILLVPVNPTAGSLWANKLISINPTDSVPPVSTAAPSPGPNANGWNNSDVTVAITATDVGGSGVKQIQYTLSGAQSSAAQIVSGSSASLTISVEGITTVTYFATDNVGNVEAAKSLTVRLDKTAPTVTFGAPAPPANAAGWNNSDVSIAFTVADPLSGVDSSTSASPLTLTTAGSAVTGTITVTDKAGNTATYTSPAVKIDKTPPVISGSRAPLANANGWNNSNVTVSFACSDGLSGLAPGSPTADTVLSSDGANQSVPGTCQDLAGNTASFDVTGINIDKTPPATTAAAAPAPNAAGWINTGVVVTFTGTDNLSGIDSCSSAASLTTEGAGQSSSSGTCIDKAGNVSAPATATGINIDKTPPVIGGSRAPAANSAGWNNIDVTASFTCSDALSGLASGNPPAPVTLTAEGENQSVTRSCQDLAGNSATYTVSGISIDKTSPGANAAAAPAPNAAGWNNTNVVVSFTGTDALSGIATCSGAASLTTEGAGQSSSGTCTDKAGNVSAPATATGINIDKTPPVIGGSRAPAANSAGWNNIDVTASFTCSDALSGLASGNPPAPVTLTAEGENQSVTRSCQDLAGNPATYTVGGISIDKTPPTANGSAAPAANAAGWNNTTVTASFTGNDSLSGIAGCTAAISLVSEGANQSASGSCTDKAGNSSTPTTVSGINIDKTPPAVAFGSPAPAPNAAGWNNSNVSISFTVTDSLSGLQSATPGASPLVLTSEGAGLRGTVMVADKAGNTATYNSPPVNIDKTPPVLVGSRAPAANANGWNNTDVTVTFTCSDALAGVASLTPGGTTVVSSEGANQSVAGACQDRAGNAAATTVGPISLDKKKPVVSNIVANPGVVRRNNGFTLKGTATDTGSGPVSAEYNVDSGVFTAMTLLDGASGLWSVSVPPPPVGVHRACVRSTDKAGNQADPVCILVPVYDPNGGSVAGAGWITSPAGAYPSSPSFTGPAYFAFAARYLPGGTVPLGETLFQTANFAFASTSSQWLVVTGARAQIKGSGVINGSGSYEFLLTAIDGKIAGGGGVDKFRIKIWNSTGTVYDNQMGSDDTGNAATALTLGSIAILP